MSIPIWMRLLRLYGMYSPIQRGKSKLTKLIFKSASPPTYPVKGEIVQGIQGELHPWQWADFCTYIMASPELFTLLCFRSWITAKTVFFDVGAYIGVYGFNAAQIAQQGDIHIFEPNPHSAKRIAQTIADSGLQQVTLCQTAVGETQSTLSFQATAYAPQSTLLPTDDTSETSIQVPVIRLDDYCQDNNIQHVDIIKIDTEGAELPVLRGAQHLLERSRPKLIIELHKTMVEPFGYKLEELFDFLEELNYEFFKVTPALTTYQLEPFSAQEAVNSRHILIALPKLL